MNASLNEVLTFLGILATLIISSISLYITVKSSRKTLFINSITANRIKWISDVRENVSKFCGLSYHFALMDLNDSERQKVFQELDQVRFIIKLQLNREDVYDRQIIDQVDKILETDPKKIEEFEKEINILVYLTQDLLKLEWEGVKLESMKGILTRKEKDSLYEKYLKIKRASR